jgi:hypothetical protein
VIWPAWRSPAWGGIFASIDLSPRAGPLENGPANNEITKRDVLQTDEKLQNDEKCETTIKLQNDERAMIRKDRSLEEWCP